MNNPSLTSTQHTAIVKKQSNKTKTQRNKRKKAEQIAGAKENNKYICLGFPNTEMFLKLSRRCLSSL